MRSTTGMLLLSVALVGCGTEPEAPEVPVEPPLEAVEPSAEPVEAEPIAGADPAVDVEDERRAELEEACFEGSTAACDELGH